MTPEQLKIIGEKLCGKWGWQTKLAKILKVTDGTVSRWVYGSTIPGPVEVALELLLREKEYNNEREKYNKY